MGEMAVEEYVPEFVIPKKRHKDWECDYGWSNETVQMQDTQHRFLADSEKNKDNPSFFQRPKYSYTCISKDEEASALTPSSSLELDSYLKMYPQSSAIKPSNIYARALHSEKQFVEEEGMLHSFPQNLHGRIEWQFPEERFHYTGNQFVRFDEDYNAQSFGAWETRPFYGEESIFQRRVVGDNNNDQSFEGREMRPIAGEESLFQRRFMEDNNVSSYTSGLFSCSRNIALKESDTSEMIMHGIEKKEIPEPEQQRFRRCSSIQELEDKVGLGSSFKEETRPFTGEESMRRSMEDNNISSSPSNSFSCRRNNEVKENFDGKLAMNGIEKKDIAKPDLPRFRSCSNIQELKDRFGLRSTFREIRPYTGEESIFQRRFMEDNDTSSFSSIFFSCRRSDAKITMHGMGKSDVPKLEQPRFRRCSSMQELEDRVGLRSNFKEETGPFTAKDNIFQRRLMEDNSISYFPSNYFSSKRNGNIKESDASKITMHGMEKNDVLKPEQARFRKCSNIPELDRVGLRSTFKDTRILSRYNSEPLLVRDGQGNPCISKPSPSPHSQESFKRKGGDSEGLSHIPERMLEGLDEEGRAAFKQERNRRIEELMKMIRARKLCLVLDLDHTLLNSVKVYLESITFIENFLPFGSL